MKTLVDNTRKSCSRIPSQYQKTPQLHQYNIPSLTKPELYQSLQTACAYSFLEQVHMLLAFVTKAAALE